MNQYFLALTPGSYRIMGGEDDTFWCCNGSAVEEFNKLSDTIYFNDGQQCLGEPVPRLQPGLERARHPDRPAHAISPGSAAPAWWWKRRRPDPGRSTCAFPSWTSDAARVLVNGKPLDAGATPGSYLRIARKWKKGDEVVLEMPMTLRTEGFADDPSWQAVLVGPIVLAGQFAKGDIPATQTKQHGPNLQQTPFAVPRNRSELFEAAEVFGDFFSSIGRHCCRRHRRHPVPEWDDCSAGQRR